MVQLLPRLGLGPQLEDPGGIWVLAAQDDVGDGGAAEAKLVLVLVHGHQMLAEVEGAGADRGPGRKETKIV